LVGEENTVKIVFCEVGGTSASILASS